jgi:hypothetical protein
VKTIRSSHQLIVFIDSYLPKLEQINRLKLKRNLNAFKLFSDKYCQQIKKLNNLYNFIGSPEVYQQLSRFKNIEELVLDLNCFNEGIDLIGVNCEKLKHLTIKGSYPGFSVFRGFYALEKLSIYLHSLHTNIQSFKPLKSCENLKSLVLSLNGFKDKHFHEIDLYLPQLKHFSINIGNEQITDKSLQSLAQLKKLSKLCLISSQLTDSGVCDFIKNSLNIKSIQLYNNFVNDITVKAFIERAKTKPNIELEFIGLKNILESDIDIRLTLPHNLTVKQID